MNQTSVPVTVRILDKDYMVTCKPEEKESLLASAQQVDGRMREIRKSGRVIGADRIAVMAALNLAYELLQQDQKTPALDTKTSARLAALHGRLDAALAESSDGRPD